MNNTVKFWVAQINKIQNMRGLLAFVKMQMEAIKYEQISSKDAKRVSELLDKYTNENNIK